MAENFFIKLALKSILISKSLTLKLNNPYIKESQIL